MKSKLIFFYEWVVKLVWKGSINGLDKKHKGKIEIPNLSDENDADEVDILITSDSDNDDSYNLKQFMHSKSKDIIHKKLALYIHDLKNEFSKGMVLPTKTASPAVKTPGFNENYLEETMASTVISTPTDVKPGKERVRCRKLTDAVKFMCEAPELYLALTEQDRVSAFTRNEAKVDAKKGGKFVLFGGNIYGEFTKLVENKQISMRWRFKSWPAEHYSTVILKLTQNDDGTKLDITHTGIPYNDYDKTEEGWIRYYWEPIKNTFGFGARLF